MHELFGPRPDGIAFIEPGEPIEVDYSTDDPTFESRGIQIGDLGRATLLGHNFFADADSSLNLPKPGLIINRNGLTRVDNIFNLTSKDELYEISIKLEDTAIVTSRSSAFGHRASRMVMVCTMLTEGLLHAGKFSAVGEDMEDFTWFYAWDELAVNPPTILTHPDPVVLSGLTFQFNGRMHLPQIIVGQE